MWLKHRLCLDVHILKRLLVDIPGLDSNEPQ